MATIRRAGFGTVFELEDSKVGIGTDAATHTLQALGNIRSEDATDIGISSLTTYQGFVDKEARFTGGQIDIESQSGATSGEIIIDGDVTVSSATTFTSGPQHLTVTDTFTLPSGDTNSRELKPTPGSLRFNQDFATLEFYTGNNWATVNTFTEIQNSPGSRGRGVFGGQGPYAMDYINIASKGNSIHFGDFSTASGGIGDGAGNETRGIFSGHGPNYRAMQYITIASEGRSVSFGDATTNTSPNSSTRVCEANSTRMLNMGDYLWTNVIDYVQIHTIGNALDFGDLSKKRAQGTGFSSPIRAMYCGGYTPGGTHLSDIEVVKFASLGNATHFGDLIKARKTNGGGTSNSVRGVVGGGTLPATDDGVSFIEFITLASEGNGTEFGNLTADTAYAGAVGSQTRAVFSGGSRNDASSNIIDFIEIATGGNAQDFGDVAGTTVFYNNGLSDCHGGLGGF
jgi:hypothetical protein